ncbi:aluminum-activated malate transporter 10-like, partial [Phalaenopsis equestris]
ANLAAWEPAHGPFGFRHPWSQYLKVGAAMRSCAYCIEALHCSSHSEIQASELMKRHLSEVCMKLSSKSAQVLKELSVCIENMRSSESLSHMVKEMKEAVEEVKTAMKSLPTTYNNELGLQKDDDSMMMKKRQSFMESLPLMTVVSLLMEISVKVEGVEEEVQKLSGLAEFKPSGDKF